MNTFDLPVTAEEIAFLANNLPAGARWPEPYDSFALSQIPGKESAGGLSFRLKVIALHTYMKQTFTDRTPKEAALPLELTEAELWFLDYMCNTLDYSKHLMGNGTPVFKFVLKVWAALLEAGVDEVDPRYLPAVQAGKIETPAAASEQQKSFLAEIDGLIGSDE